MKWGVFGLNSSSIEQYLINSTQTEIFFVIFIGSLSVFRRDVGKSKLKNDRVGISVNKIIDFPGKRSGSNSIVKI
jgi:hypothetical protein